MEALQTDEQSTPITTIKRHTAAGRVRRRPRSFEGSGGRSPLITWDLDLYPQPPLNTRSPTLNTEEPVILHPYWIMVFISYIVHVTTTRLSK